MLKWFKFGRTTLASCRPRILQVAACALLAWIVVPHGADARAASLRRRP